MFFCFRNDICNATGVGETTVMCPNCDQYCPFWKLRSSCGLSELTYIIDNDGTVFFAIFMSFWGMYFSHFLFILLFSYCDQKCRNSFWYLKTIKLEELWNFQNRLPLLVKNRREFGSQIISNNETDNYKPSQGPYLYYARIYGWVVQKLTIFPYFMQ